MNLLLFLDENKLLSSLPKYVSGAPILVVPVVQLHHQY